MAQVEEKRIPFETTRVPDSTKPVGYEAVISDGVDGKQIITKNEGGQIVSDKTVHPRNEIVFYGTMEDGETADTLHAPGENTAQPTGDSGVADNSTSEPPQDEHKKQPSENATAYEDSFVPPYAGYSIQSQGRFSELGGKLKEMFNVNVTALKKAALEAGRLLVLAIPGILITVLTDNPELGGSLGAAILLVLKSLDRGIHEDKSTASTGILPF